MLSAASMIPHTIDHLVNLRVLRYLIICCLKKLKTFEALTNGKLVVSIKTISTINLVSVNDM